MNFQKSPHLKFELNCIRLNNVSLIKNRQNSNHFLEKQMTFLVEIEVSYVKYSIVKRLWKTSLTSKKSLFLEYLIPNISKFSFISQASAGKYQIQTDKAQSQLDKTQSEFDRMQEKFERSQNEIRKVSPFKIIISNPYKLCWH